MNTWNSQQNTWNSAIIFLSAAAVAHAVQGDITNNTGKAVIKNLYVNDTQILDSMWASFKQEYKRDYSEADDIKRFQIFVTNLKRIDGKFLQPFICYLQVVETVWGLNVIISVLLRLLYLPYLL